MNYKILAINPGSTSTKVSLYENENKIFSENIEHTAWELSQFDDIPSQADFRGMVIREALEKRGVDLSELSAIAGRGGLLPRARGGGPGFVLA